METSQQQRRPTVGQSAQKLKQLGLDLDALDLVDMFWLAQFIEPAQSTHQEENRSQLPDTGSKGFPAKTVEGMGELPQKPAVSLYTDRQEPHRSEQSTTEKTDSEKNKGVPFPVPAAPALRTRLDLARSLRPLMRKVPSQSRYELDEDTTVTQVAETQLMLPVVQAQPERWLDLDLVVEDSKTTIIWERTIAEVQHLMEYQGAFRTVRTWRLAIPDQQAPEAENVKLFPRWRGSSKSFFNQRPRSPRELIDPRGRRLILFVTDCTSELWQRGLVHETLWRWAEVQPVSVLQLFPEQLWPRTTLSNGHVVRLKSMAPGLPSARLITEGLPDLSAKDDFDVSDEDQASDSQTLEQYDDRRCLVLPIVSLDPVALRHWAQVLIGGESRTPGRVFELKVMRKKGQESLSSSTSDFSSSMTARQRVALFKATASKPALALAKCMAATPVSLPIINLLRDEFVPDAQQQHVAEVLLSGLLKRVDTGDDNGSCRYEFFEDPPISETTLKARLRVRDLLLDDVPKARTISLLNRLSQLIQDRAGNTLNSFEAFLAAFEESGSALGERALPLAKVGLDVLRRLGGPHVALARQYAEVLQFSGQTTFSRSSNDFPLETFEHEVAEFVNFPPLEPFEFIDAQLVEETSLEFPPPLQTEEFTIITLELQPEKGEAPQELEAFDFEEASLEFPPPLQTEEFTIITLELQPEKGGAPQGLEAFDFTVATFIRSEKGRQIQRQQHQAYRYIEVLSNPSFFDGIAGRLGWQRDDSSVALEIVAIPSGTFLMGSPTDEPERFDSESPQHEVTIQPFFMGQYPITQSQWKVVAAMPQVQRELKPDPSRFKGAKNRPVEQVSWYDAVEFCQRLSRYTGRSYRLPTEAEWEYACRAGTTTPFHFGETISPELANYDASQAYAYSLTAYRRATTSVTQFQMANGFGLSDMHGNVFEWCQDHWHDNYEGAPRDGGAWIGGGDSNLRVRRGGSWDDDPRYCRSAYRFRDDANFQDLYIGFRVCCSAPRILT